MSSESELIEWSPPWAPHVKGRYTPRTRGENGMCEPQHVYMLCAFKHNDGRICGETWQTVCASGNVRRHINNFAKAHSHSDFANPDRVVRPNSKRG